MNFNTNIKRGASNNGVVYTDLPIEILKEMRDSINNAIHTARESEKNKYITDIIAAIDAARDNDFDVYINDTICDKYTDIRLYDNADDDDYEDD